MTRHNLSFQKKSVCNTDFLHAAHLMTDLTYINLIIGVRLPQQSTLTKKQQQIKTKIFHILVQGIPYFFTYKPSDFFSICDKNLVDFSQETGFGL